MYNNYNLLLLVVKIRKLKGATNGKRTKEKSSKKESS